MILYSELTSKSRCGRTKLPKAKKNSSRSLFGQTMLVKARGGQNSGTAAGLSLPSAVEDWFERLLDLIEEEDSVLDAPIEARFWYRREKHIARLSMPIPQTQCAQLR